MQLNHHTHSIKNDKSVMFPSISTLFSDSWYLFASRLNRFFLFTLINFAILIVFYLAFFTLVAAVIRPILNPLLQSHSTISPIQLLPTLIPGAIILFLVLIIGLIVIGAVNITWLLLSIKEDEGIPFKKILYESPAYLKSAIPTALLLTILNMGLFIFFVLPSIASGIVFFLSVFFVFSFSELIFLGKRNLSAIQRSYVVVISHFKAVALRMGSLLFAYVVLILVLNTLQIIQSPVVNWISAIFEILFSWYAICYIYLLYQQAAQHTDEEKTISKLWLWSIAIVGWILTILLIVLISFGVSYSIKTGAFQKAIDQLAFPTTQTDKTKAPNIKPSMTPQVKTMNKN